MTRQPHALLRLLLLCAVCLTAVSTTANGADVLNGSFETGDFTDWISMDLLVPFDPQSVLPAGTLTALFVLPPIGPPVIPPPGPPLFGPNMVIPSDGNFAASNGFDGQGPGEIRLSQDVGLIALGDELRFDYRAGWDLITFNTGLGLDRFFSVDIEPAGGGAPLLSNLILTAEAFTQTSGPNSDTGPMSAALDLSPLAGTNARVSFIWEVPEPFTGPANAQLDNVRIVSVPEPSGFVLLGTLSLLGLAVRRTKRSRRR